MYQIINILCVFQQTLHKLLKGQFNYMQQNGFDVFLASSEGEKISVAEKVRNKLNLEFVKCEVFNEFY